MESIVFIINEILFFVCVFGLAVIVGIFVERLGIVNIVIEGIMLVGVFGYCIILVFFISGGRISGFNLDVFGFEIILFIFAVLFGLLFLLLLGLVIIKLKVEYIIIGVVLNFLLVGICAVIMNFFFLGNVYK